MVGIGVRIGGLAEIGTKPVGTTPPGACVLTGWTGPEVIGRNVGLGVWGLNEGARVWG